MTCRARVGDLRRRARQTLFRTFVRALAKYALAQAAENQDETAGAIVNLLGVLTERADTRCWLTLPDRLAVARLRLPRPARASPRVPRLGGERDLERA